MIAHSYFKKISLGEALRKNLKNIVIETVAGGGFYTFQQIKDGNHCFTILNWPHL